MCRGLCGIFDGDKTNDFHDKEGRILDVRMNYGQVNKFAEEWRYLQISSWHLLLPEMEFKEFEPRFKSAKTRFKLSAGLNL